MGMAYATYRTAAYATQQWRAGREAVNVSHQIRHHLSTTIRHAAEVDIVSPTRLRTQAVDGTTTEYSFQRPLLRKDGVAMNSARVPLYAVRFSQRQLPGHAVLIRMDLVLGRDRPVDTLRTDVSPNHLSTWADSQP